MKEAQYLGCDENDLEKLAESMFQRIKTVYDADGGCVNYLKELDKINKMN